jgi:hypothetical protein
MRRERRPGFVFVLVAVLITFCASVIYSQDEAGGQTFRLKKVKLTGVEKYKFRLDWTVTSGKTSFLVLGHSAPGDDGDNLSIVPLKPNGKSGGAEKLLDASSGYVIDFDRVVWIPVDQAGAETAADFSHGLLFVSYFTDDEWSKAMFQVCKLTTDGKQDGAFRTIKEINPPAGATVYTVGFAVLQDQDRLWVVFTEVFDEFSDTYEGFRYTKVYLMQTDFDGNPIGTAREISLPDNGDLWGFWLYDAIRTTNGWMIMGNNIVCETRTEGAKTITDYIGNQLYLLTVTEGAGQILSTNAVVLAKDSEEELWTYSAALFLEGADLPAVPENALTIRVSQDGGYSVLYYHQKWIPREKQKLDEFKSECRLAQVTEAGDLVGKAKKIKFPKWIHTLKYDPDWYIRHYQDWISNLLGDGAGKYYFLQVRSLTLKKEGEDQYDDEHQLNIYALDAATAKVELLAQTTVGGYIGYFGTPIARWFGGKMSFVNRSIPMEQESPDSEILFSKISAPTAAPERE